MTSKSAMEEPPFPGYSRWEYRKLCCTNRAIRIIDVDVMFLGHWEASFGLPIVVTSIILSSYLVAMFIIFPYFEVWGVPISIVLSILCFLFFYSYSRIIIDGPGYFPFYYPMHPMVDDGVDDFATLLRNDDDSPAGIISSASQSEWIQGRPKPNRCVASASARRIVIRPDHFCGWTASWIGRRNHKFFILFNLWGAVYITTFTSTCVYSIIVEFVRSEPSLVVIPLVLYAITGFIFGVMTLSFACSHIHGMLANVTSWEEWNDVPAKRFNRGCLKNVEELCGPRTGWMYWVLPVSPWKGVTNEQFISEYDRGYRDPRQ